MGCSRKFEGQKSTPMHGAAYFGHYKIITLLLQYGIPTDIKNKNGQLPIDDSATDEIR
jgi:ankyrin repeat protein